MPIELRGLAPLLQVYDMPASLAFYCDGVGFTIASSSAPPPHCDWVMLELEGVQLMLNTRHEADDRPPAPDPAHVIAHGDTAIYFGAPDVDAVYAHLRERGARLDPPSLTGYGFRSVVVRDPDGYVLVFHWPAESK